MPEAYKHPVGGNASTLSLVFSPSRFLLDVIVAGRNAARKGCCGVSRCLFGLVELVFLLLTRCGSRWKVFILAFLTATLHMLKKKHFPSPQCETLGHKSSQMSTLYQCLHRQETRKLLWSIITGQILQERPEFCCEDEFLDGLNV